MSEFVNFLQSYWQYISAVILIVLEVALFIVKRSKIIDPSIYAKLVYFIQEAEAKFGAGHGDAKLSFVVESFLASSSQKYSSAYIKSCVEEILATPQKKGGSK